MSQPAHTVRPDPSLLQLAIDLSRSCPPSARAFSVGAVIVDPSGAVIATGFSREVNPDEHAEELAIRRATENKRTLSGTVLYTSMEPCSVRLSGKTSCADRIISCGISLVVFALKEPPNFVRCEGVEKLRSHGVEVVELPEYAGLVAQINRHLKVGDT